MNLLRSIPVHQEYDRSAECPEVFLFTTVTFEHVLHDLELNMPRNISIFLSLTMTLNY
jgi:hypothetical protein